jgi:TPP-dependent pyruvate/acetoin dehydrogenase alpha subunit
MFEYWKKRDPIARFEKYLLQKGWLSDEDNRKMIADVDRQLEADREAAVSSPMPDPNTTPQNVYCEQGCHTIAPKYGSPQSRRLAAAPAQPKATEAAVHLR